MMLQTCDNQHSVYVSKHDCLSHLQNIALFCYMRHVSYQTRLAELRWEVGISCRYPSYAIQLKQLQSLCLLGAESYMLQINGKLPVFFDSL